MAKDKRNRDILDDIVEGIQQALEELDRLINGRRKPARVPIPIPVENDPRPIRRDPYR